MSGDDSRETSTKVVGVRRLKEAMAKPVSTRIFTVANQKGGVGKTTTTVNIAAALSMGGLRVLVIDLDPQGNASTALGVEHRQAAGVYEVLMGDAQISDVIKKVAGFPALDCVPSNTSLANAEINLVSMVARELQLKAAIDEISANYDYIFIDCPPSLGLLTINAFAGSKELLIPIQTEYYALEGLGQLVRNVEKIQEFLNPNIFISTILLTMYDGRTRLSAQVAQEVRDFFGERVLPTAIPRSVRVSEAPSFQQTVLTYDPGSTGAQSYLQAARELALQA